MINTDSREFETIASTWQIGNYESWWEYNKASHDLDSHTNAGVRAVDDGVVCGYGCHCFFAAQYPHTSAQPSDQYG